MLERPEMTFLRSRVERGEIREGSDRSEFERLLLSTDEQQARFLLREIAALSWSFQWRPSDGFDGMFLRVSSPTRMALLHILFDENVSKEARCALLRLFPAAVKDCAHQLLTKPTNDKHLYEAAAHSLSEQGALFESQREILAVAISLHRDYQIIVMKAFWHLLDNGGSVSGSVLEWLLQEDNVITASKSTDYAWLGAVAAGVLDIAARERFTPLLSHSDHFVRDCAEIALGRQGHKLVDARRNRRARG